MNLKTTSRIFKSIISRSSKHSSNSPNSSVDDKEMSTFQKVNDWWDINGSMAPLHAYNDLRIQFIRQTLESQNRHSQLFMSKPLENKEIIDIGCGGGLLSERLARLGGNVLGLDANQNSIQVAQSHLQMDQQLINSVNYVHDTLENHKQQQKQYDIITCMEVLEHVNNLDQFIADIKAILKHDGIVFISTVNKTIAAWFYVILLAEQITQMIPKQTHNYQKFIEPQHIVKIFEHNGMQLIDSKGALYNPINNTMLPVNNQSINYMMAFINQ